MFTVLFFKYIFFVNPINHNRRYILFDGKEYNKCNEISAYSNDELLMKFKSIVEPLYLKDNL